MLVSHAGVCIVLVVVLNCSCSCMSLVLLMSISCGLLFGYCVDFVMCVVSALSATDVWSSLRVSMSICCV